MTLPEMVTTGSIFYSQERDTNQAHYSYCSKHTNEKKRGKNIRKECCNSIQKMSITLERLISYFCVLCCDKLYIGSFRSDRCIEREQRCPFCSDISEGLQVEIRFPLNLEKISSIPRCPGYKISTLQLAWNNHEYYNFIQMKII